MQSICILLCSLLLVRGGVKYDDGTIKTTLGYEYDVYSPEDREGKAILTLEGAKNQGKGRPVVSVTSVLDISGSMDNTKEIAYGDDTRLDFLKAANKYVIDRLALNSEAHQYGAVVFSTGVEELSPLMTMTEEAAKAAREKIDAIKANGRTNLYDGLMKGIQQQTKPSNGDRIRVVLLFTDGLPTAGTHLSRSRIIRSLKEKLNVIEEDIIIHVFAVGEAVNYGLLKDIAEVGGGVFDHVVKDQDIPKAFASVLGGLLTEASLNLKYAIGSIGGLKVKDVRMTGAKIDVNEGEASIFMKDLLAEEVRNFVIRYELGESNKEIKDGIRVNGTYTHAVTHEPVSMVLNDLVLIRQEGVEKTKPKSDVDLWDFRYEVCKRLNDAAVDIGRGNTPRGISKISDLRTWVEKSKYSEDAYTQLMKGDLDQLLKYFSLRKHTRRSDEGMMEGLISVIGGGRPQSVDDMFGTVKNGPTTTSKDLKIEVSDYLNGGALQCEFELPISTAVNWIEDGPPVKYHVQLSVISPIVTSSIPLSLTIVIDKDASNDGSNATYSKMIETLKTVITDLQHQPEMSLGIILSSGTVKTVLNVTKTTEIDVPALFSRIDAFEASGETALDRSVSRAIRQQGHERMDSGIQAVFIISDGDPINTDDVLRKMQIALGPLGRSIYVHAFAIHGCNSALLKNIADLGQGEYYDLLNDDGIAANVAAALWGILKIGANNIQVTAVPAETDVAIIKSLPEMAFKKDSWKATLQNLYQGERHDFLMTVTAPKTAKNLLDLTVTYTDVLKPSIANTETFKIPAVEMGSTINRQLDLMLVTTLEKATKGGLKHSELESVIDVVYDNMNKVSTTKGADDSYKDGLLSDLEKMASALENAQGGDEDDLRYAHWLTHVFIGTIKKQRTKGNGHKVLVVQDTYGNTAVEEKTKDYSARKTEPEITAPETKEGTPEATERPEAAVQPSPVIVAPKAVVKEKLPDPFVISYENVTDELTSDAQTVTITIKIEALNVSDQKPHPFMMVFVIDASQSTTTEEIAEAKEAALLKWKSIQGLPISESSSLAILAYGEKIQSILGKTSFSNLNASDIAAAFDGIVVEGEGSFKGGFEAAFDLLMEMHKGHPKHDLSIIAYIGDSIKTAHKEVDAAAFTKAADDLSFPLTFVTVTMKADVNVSYFDAFPAWMQHCVIDPSDVPSKLMGQPLVKRLRIEPNPATGVAVLNVVDGITSDMGYVLPDVRASDLQWINIKLLLPESTSSQILHMPRLMMMDMRTVSKRAMRGQPLMIKRVHVSDVMNLIDLQKKINTTVYDIDDDVDKEAWPEALKKTAEAITDIDESGTDDDGMIEVGEKLKEVGGKIYAVSGGDGSKDDVTDVLDAIKASLDVRPPPVKPEPLEPEHVSSPGGAEMPARIAESGVRYKNIEIEAPKLIFEEGVYAKTTDNEVTIGLKIKTSQEFGESIPARSIILMDASANSEAAYQTVLISEILTSLANRDGKRSVEIWKCSDTIEEIYSIDDLTQADMGAVTQVIKEVTPSGELDITKLLDFVKSIKTEIYAINVVYWITASPLPKVDTSVLTTYLKDLQHMTTMTVMTFKADKDSPYPEFLQLISSATGGWAYLFFQPGVKVDEDIIMSRIQYAAWTSVGWIEETHVKEVVVDFVGKGGALVSRITTTEDSAHINVNTLRVSSMAYEREVDVKILVDLKQVKKEEGPFDAIDATMMYVLVRNPEIREMVGTKGTIELLESNTSAKMDTLNAMMQSVGSEIFEFLGRNKVEQALKKTKDVSMQPKLAGLELPRTKAVVDLYQKIGKSIEEYLDDRYEYRAIQNVPKLIMESKTESQHYSDKGSYLNIKHFPASAKKDEKLFQSTIIIETPAESEEGAVSSQQGVITVSVVFDVAEYDFYIDDEVPMLEVQKMTVMRLLNRLIDQGYVVDLSVVGSAYDHVKHIRTKRFNQDNIDDLMSHLERIKEKGSPASLLFGLKMGLPAIQEVSDSKRIVMLFTHASNVDLVEGGAYQELLLPYITHPINPVKVLTYMVGEYKEWKSDTISGLTGGKKIHFEHVMEMSIAVDKSLESIQTAAARNVRIDVTPSGWYKGSISITWKNKVLPLGTVGDMSSNSRRTIDLEFELDDWEGDKDLFQYAVSYFHPKQQRWFQAPSRTFRLRRVNDDVIKEHQQLQQKITPLLKTTIDQLTKMEFEEASKSVYQASVSIHASQYQDDSLIRAYSDYLIQIYEDIMKLMMTKSKDATTVVDYLISEGCTLGLDVQESNATEPEDEDESEDDPYGEEQYTGDDGDWNGFTPWFKFVF